MSLKIGHDIPIGNIDVEIPVKVDGSPIGRLKTSQGGVDWLPSGSSKTHYALTWTALAAILEKEGKRRT